MKRPALCAAAFCLAVVPVLTLALAGCGEFCSQEARASLVLEVVDAQGEPASVAVIDYTVDGADPQRVNCSSTGDHGCDEVLVGSEQRGMFLVTARTPDDATGTAVVFVGETDDGCHVEPETRRLAVK